MLPRILSIILVPLFTSVLGKENYGIYTALMAYLILGNVLLSYGMETAFFRFITKYPNKKRAIQGTALSSIAVSTVLFFSLAYLFKSPIANFLEFKQSYLVYAFGILALDALVVVPFAWFRVNERPMRYAVIKIANVAVNLGLNLFFFLVLPGLAVGSDFWSGLLLEDPIHYVFLANIIASGLTCIALLPIYTKVRLQFEKGLWKEMMRYAVPILIAGIAFSINESFDKILLKYLLPEAIAASEIGVYGACYKLGVFMTLFSTAFRLGIEPFFFNHASSGNAKVTYATITKYFAILGSLILLFVVIFIDVLKLLLLPESSYWVALGIVPIILLANLCLGIYHNLSVWYKITDHTKFGAYISAIGALITLILNFVLIPKYSYMGSAWATLAAYGTMMSLSWYFGRRFYPIPYDLKKILGYMILSIGLSIISFYVLDRNYYYSIPLFLVFLVILYFGEKKDLMRILKK